MTGLLELAERCEQATGPNEILDMDISAHQGAMCTVSYTASLDAAMTLVPEGWVENYQRRFDGTTLAACHQGGSGRQTLAIAATSALALSAAALRARHTLAA